MASWRVQKLVLGGIVAGGLWSACATLPALAVETNAAPPQTQMKPAGTLQLAPVPQKNRPALDNQQARRNEDERQRRWDERMRRVTRSMCDRC